MITLENVDFQYKEMQVLKDINIQIKEDEFVAIIGVNGSGKSTLARIIAGIEIPKNGLALVDGQNTKSKKDKMEIRKKIGMVFQNPENEFVFSSVEDDITFMLQNFAFSKEEIEERIREST